MNIQEFKHYLDNFKLGNIEFLTATTIKLSILKNGLNAYIRDFSDIVAIIIFGSSIKYPAYEFKEKTRKKYILFGDLIIKTWKERYKPNDIDFLIITNKPYFKEKYIKPKIEYYSTGSSDYSIIVSNKIDLMNRSVAQVKEGLKNGDTISQSALEKGLILVENNTLNQFNIINNCPYHLYINDNNLIFNIKIKEK